MLFPVQPWRIRPSLSRSCLARRAAVVVVLFSLGRMWATEPTAQESRSPGAAASETHSDYDVVIVGGSTAALAAALAAADEGMRTALLEPTDWIGGQLTSSGVPAVDECWHRFTDPASGKVLLNASGMARDPKNMNPAFRGMLERIGNPGRGWVSRFCFEPAQLLAQELIPMVAHRSDRLTVYCNTVIKRVELDGGGRRIISIHAIRRIPRPDVAWNGYDRFPSEDLADWYAYEPSSRFDKQGLHFVGKKSTVFLDASEWGELLALCGDRYLQGVESSDGAMEGEERCGQCITFGLVQRFREKPREEPRPKGPEIPRLGFGQYAKKPDAWNQVWTYRRIRSVTAAPAPGDLCLQNWGYYPEMDEGGNDYPYGYLFLSRSDTAAQRSDWRGGVDVEVLHAAAERAVGWHFWYKDQAPEGISPGQIELAQGVLGTGHGLSKLPYIRDTRRSIGLDGFILTYADLSGDWQKTTATPFPDRIALGCYAADIHAMHGCKYPAYVHPSTQPLPFYIPFRALTHQDVENLLVAGKTMAQSFLANSATRLHPIEWTSGTAAGAAASLMAKRQWSSAQLYASVSELRDVVRKYQPVDWTPLPESP